MEFTTLQFVILALFLLAIAALYGYQTTFRKDVNKCFKFEVSNTHGRIVMKAINEMNPSLGFEAHFYSRPSVTAEPTVKPMSSMQQYFGKRVYTFVTTMDKNGGVDTTQIGQEIIKLSLADRRTMSDHRVDFDLQLIHDLVFGMYYDELQGAAVSYSQEMYDTMTSASREFIQCNRDLPKGIRRKEMKALPSPKMMDKEFVAA